MGNWIGCRGSQSKVGEYKSRHEAWKKGVEHHGEQTTKMVVYRQKESGFACL